MIEIAESSQANAGRPYDANPQNAQSNQPHAPDRGRRFYLAIPGRHRRASADSPPNMRCRSKSSDETRFRSLRLKLRDPAHDQVARLRREARQIDSSTDA